MIGTLKSLLAPHEDTPPATPVQALAAYSKLHKRYTVAVDALQASGMLQLRGICSVRVASLACFAAPRASHRPAWNTLIC